MAGCKSKLFICEDAISIYNWAQFNMQNYAQALQQTIQAAKVEMLLKGKFKEHTHLNSS